jgi:hypothetical protein
MAVRTIAVLLAGATLVVLGATACGGDTPGPGDTTPGPSSTTPAGDANLGTAGAPTTTATTPPVAQPDERMPASWRACDNPPAGYSIGYPGDWYTESLDGQFACSFFDPEPFTILPNSEFPRVALQAGPTDTTVATYRGFMTDPENYTVVRDEDVMVLDRPGVRFETVSLGMGLDEPGIRRYGYIIDSGGGDAFAVFTTADPGETRYDDWKFVVDIARDSVRFLH